MSNFIGQTVTATNPNTGAQEQAVVVEVQAGSEIKVQFSDGALGVAPADMVVTG